MNFLIEKEKVSRFEKGAVYFCKSSLFIILICTTIIDGRRESYYDKFRSAQGNLEEYFTIDQVGCTIPRMTVKGRFIEKYLKTEDDVVPKCEVDGEMFPGLVIDNDTSIMIDSSRYDVESVVKLMDCKYTPFGRKHSGPTSHRTYDDYNTEFFNYDVEFEKSVTMKEHEDFVKVRCNLKYGPKSIYYEDYFAFTPIKSNVESGCEFTKFVNNKKDKNEKRKSVSVLIIDIDSLSRLNFYRQLRKTSKLLESLNAVEMFGYNTVGEYTFSNLIPVLTGKSIEEIGNECWNGNSYFDKCPFIWNTYSRMGYRTALAEECSNIAAFSYIKDGFDKQPTDYYYRPFEIMMNEAKGHFIDGRCNICFGSRLRLEVLLDYARKYVDTMNGKEYFGFFRSSSLSRDHFSLPRDVDGMIFELLNEFTEFKLLDNTVLILMSDYGFSNGGYAQTQQGHLESRLPLLTFVFPEWFEEEYTEAIANIQRNRKRLTTPFDLHETLNDLSNLTSITNRNINARNKELKRFSTATAPRGISLFLNANADRNCVTSGIPTHFCTCIDY